MATQALAEKALSMNRTLVAVAALALVAVLAIVAFGLLRTPTSSASGPAENSPDNWTAFRGNSQGWSYSPLNQINKENVADLQFLYSAPLEPGPIASSPLALNGTLYIAAPNDVVVAIKAETGDLVWQYRRSLPEGVDATGYASQPIARSLAVYQNHLIHATLDGYLMALERDTGKVVWEKQVSDYTKASHASGPLVVKDLVISGRTCKAQAGADCSLSAHKAQTGEEVWRINLLDDAAWGDIPLEQRSLGGAWMTGTYDPELDLVFWGTASALGEASTGDNASYVNATLAINPANGEVRWRVGHFAGPSYSHVFERLVLSPSAMPSPNTVGWSKPGLSYTAQQKVLSGIPGSTGLVWTLDATTGEFLWANNTLEQNLYQGANPDGSPKLNSSLPERACPGIAGGRSWPATAFSPTSESLFVSLANSCSQGETAQANGADLGRLKAISLATGKTIWEYQQPQLLGSALATGGGLVFVGDLNRRLRAFDQDTGAVLWEQTVIAPITGNPITYNVNGQQYVSVVVGGGTDWEEWQNQLGVPSAFAGSNSVFTFALAQTAP